MRCTPNTPLATLSVSSVPQVNFGGNWIYMQAQALNKLNRNGSYTFNGQRSGSNLALVDFLLGLPSSFGQAAPVPSLQTETVYRVGDSPGSASAAKVGGGAIGGAILGAILGGGKGAAIGGAVGAAGGTAAVMAGGRRAATISAGSPVTVKVLSPVTVNVEKE